MSAARALLAIARADFRERVRRHAFLVTVGFTLAAAYGSLPLNHARYATLQFDGHRGIYNSAWVGSLVALLTTTFLSLAGFYLVKNAVERDRRSGVGVILAATPVSKIVYLLGKTLSNLAVLATMVAVMALGAGAMQQLRGEERALDLAQLLLPFAVFTLPAMAVVASVAALFEVTPKLRGGLGNTVYFFLWISTLGWGAARHGRGGFDLLGVGWVLPSMAAACHRAFPSYDLAAMPMSLGVNFRQKGVWDLTTFTWSGPEWSGAMLASRLACLATAAALVGLAALWFDRFDAAAPSPATRPRRGFLGWASRRAAPRPLDPVLEPEPRGDAGIGGRPAAPRLTPLPARRRFGIARWVRGELFLMLRGAPLAWWLVAGGLFVATWLAPLWAAWGGLMAALWIWPLLFWSALGNREARHGTEALLFSVPRPVLRPVLAQWIAGATLALGLATGVGIRLVASGDLAGLARLIAGGLFIPALAVALGSWSGSGKLFEIVYLILWYGGPASRAAPLDYTGSLGGGPAAALAWLVATAALLAAAVAGRAVRMRR